MKYLTQWKGNGAPIYTYCHLIFRALMKFNPNRSLGLVVFRNFIRMNFACLLMSDSELLRIKRQAKFILIKAERTQEVIKKILTRPNDRFGFNTAWGLHDVFCRAFEGWLVK